MTTLVKALECNFFVAYRQIIGHENYNIYCRNKDGETEKGGSKGSMVHWSNQDEALLHKKQLNKKIIEIFHYEPDLILLDIELGYWDRCRVLIE